MTAEVAILNKKAVVLAADSAMTLSGTGKVYPTNKLFTLSKYQPVGIMIYNNAEFMGVPWEILIKMFREKIGDRELSTLDAYVDDFFKFLGQPQTCTKEQCERSLIRIAADVFEQVRNLALTEPELEEIIKSKKEMTDLALEKGLLYGVKIFQDEVAQAERCPSVDKLNASKLLMKHRVALDQCIDHVFYDLPVTEEFREELFGALNLAIKHEFFSRGHSGVVIAGFGSDDLFPSIREVHTDGMIGDTIKCHVQRSENIARDGMQTAVMPFAQSEMVEQFMEGVDREYLNYLSRFVKELLLQGGLDDNTANDLVEVFKKGQSDFRKQRFKDPVIEIVKHLPKEELASMAEALVSLTSLKRRVSADQETVGGPTDVAVISKGDGFIWIKRKHYFNSQLNPQFLHNYNH